MLLSACPSVRMNEIKLSASMNMLDFRQQIFWSDLSLSGSDKIVSQRGNGIKIIFQIKVNLKSRQRKTAGKIISNLEHRIESPEIDFAVTYQGKPYKRIKHWP